MSEVPLQASTKTQVNADALHNLFSNLRVSALTGQISLSKKSLLPIRLRANAEEVEKELHRLPSYPER